MVSRLRHILMRPLTYVVLKTFSSLKDDLNVASNLEFFMLFCTSSHISGAENTSEFAFFYWTNTPGFQTEGWFNDEVSIMRSREKPFETLHNSIVKKLWVPLAWGNKIVCLFLNVFINWFMKSIDFVVY